MRNLLDIMMKIVKGMSLLLSTYCPSITLSLLVVYQPLTVLIFFSQTDTGSRVFGHSHVNDYTYGRIISMKGAIIPIKI